MTNTSDEHKAYPFAGSKIDILYRKLATGFCFLVFMSGGLVGTTLFLPLIRFLPLSSSRRAEMRLGFVHWGFKSFMRFMWLMRVIRRYEVVGRPKPNDPPAIYIANHPSLIDVVAIMGVIPKCNCIVKSDLFRHPFMGGVLRGCGMIPNDSGPDLLERIEQEIAMGRSLMIFPEGTRSPQGGLNPFNRGAARLVLHLNLDVVPIHISCTPPTLLKGRPWHDTPPRAVDFKLEFLPRTRPTDEVDTQLPVPRQVRWISTTWETLYREILGIASGNLDALEREVKAEVKLPFS